MVKFKYAIEGIISAYRSELHMKIHIVMASMAVILGIYCHINILEWCVILLCIGSVIALELINTAIEAVVDLITPNYHPLAKIAKDVAAGAVLIMAIIAAICGIIIFIPKLI